MVWTGAKDEICERRLESWRMYVDPDWYKGAEWRYKLSPIKDLDDFMRTMTWLKQTVGPKGVGRLAGESEVAQPAGGVYKEYLAYKAERLEKDTGKKRKAAGIEEAAASASKIMNKTVSNEGGSSKKAASGGAKSGGKGKKSNA